MYDDVVDLRDFYRSTLGQTVGRIVRRRLRQLWPNVTGETVLGLGYAAPFLRPAFAEAGRLLAFMPAGQGAVAWPPQELNKVALIDETELPLPDLSIDRALLVHCLERTEQLRPMLREIWRVLSPSGRLMVVVANRRGIWARLDRTPFGSGSPFSPSQVSRLLRDTLFTPIQTKPALFIPPTRNRMVLTSATAWERIGEEWLTGLSGLIVVEASKQIYALAPGYSPASRRRSVPSRPRLIAIGGAQMPTVAQLRIRS